MRKLRPREVIPFVSRRAGFRVSSLSDLGLGAFNRHTLMPHRMSVCLPWLDSLHQLLLFFDYGTNLRVEHVLISSSSILEFEQTQRSR